MNIVFYFSEPASFFPVFPDPIPPEMFSIESESPFDRLLDTIKEYFPESEITAVDSGEKPVIHNFHDDIDILHLPAKGLFSKIFLYSSFCTANQLPPVSLWIPGNTVLTNPEYLAFTIRRTLKNPLSTASLTLFGDTKSSASFYLETGEIMQKEQSFRLCSLKSFSSSVQFRKWQDDHPDQADKNPYSADTGIFILNTLKFSENLAESAPDLQELYYLLIDSWKDEHSVRTALRDTSALLDGKSFREWILSVEERLCSVSALSLEKISGIRNILSYLETDDAGNFSYGKVQLKNSRGCIAVNCDQNEMHLEDLTDTMALAADGKTSIRKI